MTARVAIGKWFNHRRGFAGAVSGVFIALGFNSSPALLNQLIDWYNWQQASLILAAILGLLMSAFGWIFFRDNPEQCGLIMDGKVIARQDDKPANPAFETVKEFTRAEALRTFPFWVFSFAAGTVGMVMTALTFHVASLGREMGLDRGEVYALFIPMSLFSIGANFIASWVSDRIRHKWLLVAMMIAQVVGLVGLTFLWSQLGQWAFFVGQGTAVGMFIAAATVMLPRFYGREHLGAINGFNFSIMVFSSAIGPLLFSGFQNITGSYKEVLVGTIIIPLVLLILSFYVINPQQKVMTQA
jgi:cyanate permease